MCTKPCSPPSLRQLLLLSAFALVACSKASMVSGVSNGPPNQLSNLHRETAAKEERTFSLENSVVQPLTTFTKKIVVSLPFVTDGHIDRLIRTKLVLRSGMFRTPAFIDVAKYVEQEHSRNTAMNLLFDGLMRVKDKVVMDDLLDTICLFKDFSDRRIPLSKIDPGTLSGLSSADLFLLSSIVEGFQHRLLRRWKSKWYTPSQVQELLEVDVEHESFLKDPRAMLWCDYAVFRKGHGSSFDYARDKLVSKFRNKGTATKLLAAGAMTKPGVFVEGVMNSLFTEWRKLPDVEFAYLPGWRNEPSRKLLLGELVPSIEVGILDGPLVLWIKCEEADKKEPSFKFLVRSLVWPGRTNPEDNYWKLPKETGRDLELVDAIAAKWSKDLVNYRSGTQTTSPSSYADSIFFELCETWRERSWNQDEVRRYLRIDELEDSPQKSGRLQAWMVFVYRYTDRDEAFKVLGPIPSDKEKVIVLAQSLTKRSVNWNPFFAPLFRKWREEEMTNAAVFDKLELKASSHDLFQNPLLFFWFNFRPDPKENSFSHTLQLRDWLKGKRDSKTFESELQDAVETGDPWMKSVLFDLLVSRWIVDETAVNSATLSRFLISSKEKKWYSDLQWSHQHLVRAQKEASPPSKSALR